MWATEPHGPSARVGCGEHGTGKSRLGSRKPFYVLRPAATLRLRSWLETECGIEICQGCLRTKAAKHAAYLRTRLSRGLAKSENFSILQLPVYRGNGEFQQCSETRLVSGSSGDPPSDASFGTESGPTLCLAPMHFMGE